MKNLLKMFCAVCAVWLFQACEDTYNGKLFWPGEISQEYGSYIKPYALDLTYSGEKMTGKIVRFETDNSESGRLILQNVIPGEVSTTLSNVLLCENEQKNAYSFSGKCTTENGNVVEYEGSIAPKIMKLSLNVTMAHADKVAKTFALSQYDYSYENGVVRNSGAGYAKIILPAGLESMSDLVLQGQQMATRILDVLFPYLLKDITLEPNGMIGATVATSPFNKEEFMGLAKGSLTNEDFEVFLAQRTYEAAPKGLAFWSQTGENTFEVRLNLPGILHTMAAKQGKDIDPQLMAGICEALLKASPERMKQTLSALNMVLNNKVLTYILQLDEEAFTTLYTWLKNGFPMGIDQATEGHTYIYFNKESLRPFMGLIDAATNTQLSNLINLLRDVHVGIDLV